MKTLITALLSVCLGAGVAVAAQAAAPAIAFSNDAITVSGATPRGKVILFSAARVPRHYYVSVIPSAQRLSDDDGDGVVQLPLNVPVPQHSVWGAIDLTNGLLTLAPAPGAALDRVELPGASLHQTAPGQVRKLDFDRDDLYVVVVRPGTSAWSMAVRDGGHRDEDRTPNGRVALPFESMQEIGATDTPAPANVRPGDVLVVIDLTNLRVFSLGGQQ